MKLILSFLCCIWLFALPGFSQEPVEISIQESFSIGKNATWLEDEEGVLTATEALESQGFTSSESDNLNFGLTRSTYWVRFSVNNQSYFNDWLLLIDFPQNSFVTLYEPAVSGNKPLFESGFLKPFKMRPVNAAIFAFPLDLADNNDHTFLLRVQSDRAMIIPLILTREPVFRKEQHGSNLGYGIYFGIMIGLLLYNLFLFFGLRDRAYLYYVFFLLSSIALFASISGKSFQFLFQSEPVFNRLLIEISSALLAFFSAHFTLLFLKIRRYSTLLYYALQGIKGLAIVCLIMIFTLDIRIVQPVLYLMLTLDIILLLISGILSWKKRNAYAGYFVVAWLGYMIGGMLTMGRDQGHVPFNFVTNHAAEIGSALEAVLLSLALSKRYQIYRKEKEAAIKRSLEIQEEANENLERKVIERTTEVRAANEKLNEMFRVVLEQKTEIEEKNNDITSSITYAQRIQNSILPTPDVLKRVIPDHFILYRPMHIVSGDYYWVNEKDNRVVVVVADCTGHGVPGAFMSMIGSVLLDQIVVNRGVMDPGQILSELDEGIRKLLRQENSEINDGMDVAVLVYDRTSRELLFSGAMLPLYYIQFGELHEVKGSRHPVGGIPVDKRIYETHSIKMDVSTLVYLSTDGYKDQFGGFKGRKFMASQFRALLHAVHHLPLPEQKSIIEKTHRKWMGNTHAQTDDILVFGLRLN